MAARASQNFGERDGGGFGVVDNGFAVGRQGGYGEGHGDAVVAEGIELRGVELLASGDHHAVGKLLGVDAHVRQLKKVRLHMQ